METLEKYPWMGRRITELLEHRLNQIEKDPNNAPTKEIVQLARALKALTETQYRALLIDRWSITEAEQLVRNMKAEAGVDQSKPGDDNFEISIIGEGGKPITWASSQELEQIMRSYMDEARGQKSKAAS